MTLILIDDTVMIGVIKEALNNLGLEFDPYPPGNIREPNATAVEAARTTPSLRGRDIITILPSSQIVSAVTRVRRRLTTVLERNLLNEIEGKIYVELGSIILTSMISGAPRDPLSDEIKLHEPDVVISNRSNLPIIGRSSLRAQISLVTPKKFLELLVD